MTTTSAPTRYHPLSMGLHWLMLLLFIGVYGSMELRELFEKGTPLRDAFKSAHYMLGLLVLALVGVRAAARLVFPAPAITPTPSARMQLLAKLGNLALYALMLGMPLAGWLMLSAAGKPIPFFGLNLPALIGENKELGRTIKEVHEVMGNLGYALIGGHALAAIYHHRVLRDSTLLGMLPWGKAAK
ncbi:MAG: cytochrome b [Rhodoferax sp.]|nr:MAG: cytochrome b [Rhodoferax sp.]